MQSGDSNGADRRSADLPRCYPHSPIRILLVARVGPLEERSHAGLGQVRDREEG